MSSYFSPVLSMAQRTANREPISSVMLWLFLCIFQFLSPCPMWHNCIVIAAPFLLTPPFSGCVFLLCVCILCALTLRFVSAHVDRCLFCFSSVFFILCCLCWSYCCSGLEEVESAWTQQNPTQLACVFILWICWATCFRTICSEWWKSKQILCTILATRCKPPRLRFPWRQLFVIN